MALKIGHLLFLRDQHMQPWVLITGGAKRLGRATCLGFAASGWNVACHFNASAKDCDDLEKEIANQYPHVKFLGLKAQLASNTEVEALFQTLTQTTGEDLLCVVNNASLFEPDTADAFDQEQALEQLRVNLLAPMRLGQLMAALHSKANGSHNRPSNMTPSLVHILDQKVFNLNPDYFSYTLSKLALERAVSLQAQGLAPTVRVNAVAPGLMYPSGPQSQSNFDKAASVNLLHRPIDPEHVVQCILFLAQNPALTGTTLRADNGQHLVPLERDVMNVVDQLLKGQ
jgi:NAD(P)-dependent dehydrogenase (short-subunit alcohol dehydrogenase family)